MTLITKPDFTYVWASGGAVVAPNDSKKQLGWVAEAPPFQYDNWLQNRQDQMLAHINQRGIPAWDALTNYEAGSLSYVQGSDGKIYKSVAASGPSATVQNPTADGTDTYWTVAFADVGAFLTQTAGDARYTQRSNNLSDLTNVATARTNLGVQNAVEAGIQGSFSNLKLSSTGISALVPVTADSVCVKNTSNFQVVLNNINLSTLSLAASGANGLDAGTSAANTWYSVWVIWNGTTPAGLLSLSATSPTMPVGYTHKARVGWVRSDSTANKYPLSFIQSGRSVQYKVAAGSNMPALPIMASGSVGNISTPTWISVALANYIPTTAVRIKGVLSPGSSASSALICAPNNAYGGYGSASNPPPAAVNAPAGILAANIPFDFAVESPNMYWASAAATGLLAAFGWEDGL